MMRSKKIIIIRTIILVFNIPCVSLALCFILAPTIFSPMCHAVFNVRKYGLHKNKYIFPGNVPRNVSYLSSLGWL